MLLFKSHVFEYNITWKQSSLRFFISLSSTSECPFTQSKASVDLMWGQQDEVVPQTEACKNCKLFWNGKESDSRSLETVQLI